MRYCKLVFLLGISLALIGCSTDNQFSNTVVDDGTTSEGFYDFWEYIVSDKEITLSYDQYETDSQFIPTGSVNIGAYTKSVKVYSTTEKELLQDNGYREEYTLIDNLINTVYLDDQNQTLKTLQLPHMVDINDKIVDTDEECYVTNHLNSYTPYVGYTFNDLIEVSCVYETGGFTIDYYAKGVGLVTTKSNFGTHSLEIANVIE